MKDLYITFLHIGYSVLTFVANKYPKTCIVPSTCTRLENSPEAKVLIPCMQYNAYLSFYIAALKDLLHFFYITQHFCNTNKCNIHFTKKFSFQLKFLVHSICFWQRGCIRSTSAQFPVETFEFNCTLMNSSSDFSSNKWRGMKQIEIFQIFFRESQGRWTIEYRKLQV